MHLKISKFFIAPFKLFVASLLIAVLFPFAVHLYFALNVPALTVSLPLERSPDTCLYTLPTLEDALFQAPYVNRPIYALSDFTSLGLILASVLFLELFIFSKVRATQGRFALLKKTFFLLMLQLLLILPLLALIAPDAIVSYILLDKAEEIVQDTTNLLLSDAYRHDLGIIESLPEIQQKLSETQEIPYLINNDEFFTANLVLAVLNLEIPGEKTLLYGVAVPNVLYGDSTNQLLTQVNADQLLLPNNILAVAHVSKEALSTLLPDLSRTILKEYFPDESAVQSKPVPEFKVLTEVEYIKLREDQQRQREQEILSWINLYKTELSDIASYIGGAQQDLKNLQAEYKRYNSYGKAWLNDCRTQHWGRAFCDENERTFKKELAELKDAEATIQANIKDAENYRRQVRGWLYEANALYTDFKDNPVTPEFEAGTFVSPNTVQLAFDRPDVEDAFFYYLYTLNHEQLHYLSFGKTPLDRPLEEALTDYFSLASFTESDLDYVVTSLACDYSTYGYEPERTVIFVLAQSVPKKALTRYYFDGKERNFRHAFESVYSLPYKRFVSQLNALFYMPLDAVDSRQDTALELIDTLEGALKTD